MASTVRSRLLHRINAEREAQVSKWGEQHHPDISDRANSDTYSSMADRYKAINDASARAGAGTNWANILLEEVYEALGAAGTSTADLMAELTQVAAVAVAWQEDLNSRGLGV